MNSPVRDDPKIDFKSLPRSDLEAMQKAADDMIGVLEQAAQEEKHILIDVLSSTAPDAFTQWQHYPPGDVHDREKGALWFYHAHSEDPEARPWAEHGHFHLFVYTEHVQDGIEPIALPPEPDFELGGLCHLVAISFDQSGTPMRIFTVNRWVAMEWQYPAEEVIRLLDFFDLDNEEYALTSRWLVAALKLFRPQIEWSLRERDIEIARLREKDPEGFSEDEDIEVLSSFPFDLGGQIAAIEEALDA
ncbi:DUF6969 family protein [Hoeflea prorocentri]|uniref:DUF6969 domain-containing protein n=1 Tax=Hoeflea prorocentri TaxID=1922333 RepID=A0A9X3UEJ9_9HYPH|nr:hypothetical protein [Hoeflea prorocentri]MCY6379877.1 hypothetical protein [Hoeflea prorocentri]MDA5397677.1 hypothetical protein [Hoeflea prorocentri]